MSSQVHASAVSHQLPPLLQTTPRKRPRVWPPAVLLPIFWAAYCFLMFTSAGQAAGFMGFLIVAGIGLVVLLLFAIWWLAASRVGIGERFLVFAVAIAAGIGATFLKHKLIGMFMLFPGLPMVLTAWYLGLLIFRNLPSQARGIALSIVVCLSWGAFLLLRAQGMGGDGQFALHWRWSLTPEQKYLTESQWKAEKAAAQQTLTLGPGDWAGFRGPNRDGDLHGVRIATNWDSTPPKPVWRRGIGPGWSSFAVVGDRIFTQEQLDKLEAVACLDAATGRTIWSHQDTARHEDVQGEAGPRATPTFANGRIYSQGATGILNCLDASTGELKWTHNIVTDAGTKTPMWGFSGSPLVVGNLVIVFAGGDTEVEKTLLAYHADSGERAWSAQAGGRSYSSPQLVSLGGESQILFVSEQGIRGFDPTSGAVLWHHPTPAGNPGVPRAIQPRVVGSNQVVFDAGPDIGTMSIDVKHDNGQWSTSERWVSRHLKPSFNDFVLHGNALYGFDNRVFTCVDVETGKRRWKDGDYGSGQVLLLGDQPLLLVITDKGEVVLVAANPNEHQELARFKAIKGKTWNHPVIAHGRLYVRNAEEMACYELRPAATP